MGDLDILGIAITSNHSYNSNFITVSNSSIFIPKFGIVFNLNHITQLHGLNGNEPYVYGSYFKNSDNVLISLVRYYNTEVNQYNLINIDNFQDITQVFKNGYHLYITDSYILTVQRGKTYKFQLSGLNISEMANTNYTILS